MATNTGMLCVAQLVEDCLRGPEVLSAVGVGHVGPPFASIEDCDPPECVIPCLKHARAVATLTSDLFTKARPDGTRKHDVSDGDPFGGRRNPASVRPACPP